MAAKKKNDGAGEISIPFVAEKELVVCLLGTNLLMNRQSEKIKRELLYPARKKNAAERATTLKHDPLQEYRASVYRDRAEDPPTRLIMPAGAFKKAIASAALDIPGASKAQVGRLVRPVVKDVSVYGIPQLSMMGVRQAGINKTPDIRTRAILPVWACELTLSYPTPLITERVVVSLLTAAGIYIGVGDGRPEKGSSLSCGCFKVVAHTDPQYLAVLASGGVGPQEQALEEPEFYDSETEELYRWFYEELERREQAPAEEAPARGNGRMKGKKVSVSTAADDFDEEGSNDE